MTYEQGQERIRQIADDEFLEKLVECARIFGWYGDYFEIMDFVNYVYYATGKESPEHLEDAYKFDEK